MAIPESITTALAVLSDQQGAPEGVEEAKHAKRDRQKDNAERAAVTALVLGGFEMLDRIAVALEKLAAIEKPAVKTDFPPHNDQLDQG